MHDLHFYMKSLEAGTFSQNNIKNAPKIIKYERKPLILLIKNFDEKIRLKN